MERPSKRLCVMFNGKCDRCGHVPCHADHIPSPSPESLEGIMDIPNPIEPNVLGGTFRGGCSSRAYES